MQTWRGLSTWQKVLVGAVGVTGVYVVYRWTKKGKETSKPSKLPVEEEDEVEVVKPDIFDEPPDRPGPLGVSRPGRIVKRQNFAVSDNASLPPPVKGSITDHGDGTFTVRFNHANGFVTYRHHTRQAADLRLDSMIEKPSEWTCEASYDDAFDAWVCTANAQPGDMIARGFHDTERGPAPWFVVWDGEQYIAGFMPDLTSGQEELGRFDDALSAIQAAAGT